MSNNLKRRKCPTFKTENAFFKTDLQISGCPWVVWHQLSGTQQIVQLYNTAPAASGRPNRKLWKTDRKLFLLLLMP
jgi:hypothetical protein